jgi:hypothetical protein
VQKISIVQDFDPGFSLGRKYTLHSAFICQRKGRGSRKPEKPKTAKHKLWIKPSWIFAKTLHSPLF